MSKHVFVAKFYGSPKGELERWCRVTRIVYVENEADMEGSLLAEYDRICLLSPVYMGAISDDLTKRAE